MNASQPFRRPVGGNIDRTKPLGFTFEGRRLYGFEGDTLASALLANGVRVVGRSFKYHRPRGVFSAGWEEPNAIVQLIGRADEPNVRATMQPLYEGLTASAVNRWPSLGFDVGAINNLLSGVFTAGFYYKTFMGGPGWNTFGPLIRRMAGLGRAPTTAGIERYEKRFHHCDVLIAGAGPAGLAAALVAARSGARVLLVDDAPRPGGQLLTSARCIDGVDAATWADAVVSELDQHDNVVRLSSANVVGYYDHNFLTVVERDCAQSWLDERLWKVRAKQVVLATGASERPLVFVNNDRPGVMLTNAALTYAERFAVTPGRRAIVVTNNSSAYAPAIRLAAHGLHIACIIDTRASIPQRLRDAALQAGIAVHASGRIIDVYGTHRVRGVRVIHGDAGHQIARLECDNVLVSGGWNPLVHLHSQTGAKPVYEPTTACFVPGQSIAAERSAGACAGVFSLPGCLASGAHAGAEAVRSAGFTPAPFDLPSTDADHALDIMACWSMPASARGGKAFVDYQNDVTAADLSLAVQEGFRAVEHVKRYTTTGMGIDQGKLGNTNAIGILSGALGITPGEVGTTTYRPPYVPMSFGVIAGNDLGQLIVPSRRTAITDWNEQRGAVMFEAGSAYRRPSYYPQGNETMSQAIHREVLACRNQVGIYDGSPLGKFELEGPDSVAFLERVYTHRFADLEVNRGRFALMLREDGRLLDDGVVFRLGEHKFWLFCGTGATDHLQMHLLRLLQLEWPEMRAFLTTVTTQWTNICVCGPHAREVLEAAVTDIDLEPGGFPFMALRHGHIARTAARVARVGYTGELSFEINVPTGDGLRVWEALWQAGQAYGITPVGSESSMVMRCEKGFVSPGFEGDGIVNPYDAGLGWVVDETKPDFIGKRMLERDRAVGGIRPKVVGLLPNDPSFVPPDGTPVVDTRQPNGEPNIVGYVSQGCMSPTLERSIALAVVDDGITRLGQQVTVSAVHGDCLAEITKPVFYDARGTRMR